MTLPPGPYTAEVIKMIVKERVAEIRANLKTMQRSVDDVQVVIPLRQGMEPLPGQRHLLEKVEEALL